MKIISTLVCLGTFLVSTIAQAQVGPAIVPALPTANFHQCKNIGAFAAVLDDGTIAAWGSEQYGGTTPQLPEGRKAISIISAGSGFTAVLDDGTIKTWGNVHSPGDMLLPNVGWYTPLTPTLPVGKKIIGIASTTDAFTACFDDGSIQSWGSEAWGGVAPFISHERKVVSIVSTRHSFAALLDDGTITTWGDGVMGGNYVSIPSGKKVTSISSTQGDVAVLFDDGTVQSWGDDIDGARYTRTRPFTPSFEADKQIVSLTSTDEFFIASFNDGSVETWGSAGFVTQEPPSNKKIFSMAFTLWGVTRLFNDETIQFSAAPGTDNYYGDTPQQGSFLSSLIKNKKIIGIASTDYAFTACFDDGTLQSWGNDQYGGKTPVFPRGRKMIAIAPSTGLMVLSGAGDALSPAIHAGTSNKYDIGNPNNPVIAEEYCAFLNTERVYQIPDPRFINFGGSDNTDYFDSVLMDANSEQSCIVRTVYQDAPFAGGSGVIVVGPGYTPPSHYRYTVKEKCGGVIIDALCSEAAQKNFNEWRKNPTAQEYCDYINMISSSFNGEAIESPEAFENALHDRYPDASLSLNPEGYNFAEKICAGTNLETLNKLKSQSSQDGTPNQEEHYFLIGNGWNGFLAYDEEVRGLFKLKDDKSDALFPDIPKQIIIVPGMEYCRPSRIDESIGWY